MGWAAGSEIAENIWNAVWPHIPKKSRGIVARRIIKIFEDADCDTMDECEQLIKDAGKLRALE